MNDVAVRSEAGSSELARPRKDYNAGDFWCIAEGCEREVSAMVLCSECGVRFACDVWEHRFILHRIERRRRHLRRYVQGCSFFAHGGWPWVRKPPLGNVDREFETALFDWTNLENQRARKDGVKRGRA